MPHVNAALERICAKLEAEANARWPRKPMPPPAAQIPEMSEEGFRDLMHYFGHDRGQIITIAGDPLA